MEMFLLQSLGSQKQICCKEFEKKMPMTVFLSCWNATFGRLKFVVCITLTFKNRASYI